MDVNELTFDDFYPYSVIQHASSLLIPGRMYYSETIQDFFPHSIIKSKTILKKCNMIHNFTSSFFSPEGKARLGKGSPVFSDHSVSHFRIFFSWFLDL